MKTPSKTKCPPTPVFAALLGLFVFAGCDKLKMDQQFEETRPPAKLICITLDSPDLLPKCGEIALAVAGDSTNPGDRIVIIDATRTALIDCSVQEPEWLEPLGDVRRRFRRELENAIADIKVPTATSDAERFSQGHLMLHIQREFSNVSAPDKILVMVSKTFSTFATVDKEDLAVFGPEEIIEDLGARGMVSDLAGFRVFRTGPASGDIKMDQLYDKLWSAYFRQSGVEDYRRVGWESAVGEISESVNTKETL